MIFVRMVVNDDIDASFNGERNAPPNSTANMKG
jgi:hypothetical protein